jgi:integrase
MASTRRRSRGEGHVGSYQTKAGVRWYWKASLPRPDGSVKVTWRRGFTTKRQAQEALQAALVGARRGGYIAPSKRITGSWLDEWLGTLRLAPSSVASYRKNVRLHVQPHIGQVPLARLSSAHLDTMYREPEASGRRDGRGGLSARTVRYIHTIVNAALQAAVDAEPQLLVSNPARKAHPPTAKEAQSPEMTPWTAEQLTAFLSWSAENSPLHAAWYVLAYTGMRRGELLALRWRDVDLAAGTVSIARSVGVVRSDGEPVAVIESAPKTAKSRRIIDIDPATVAVLRAWKRERGELSLVLARDSSTVFGSLEGGHLHPERFWRTFKNALARCRAELGDDALPMITIHDLRHTHASLLLSAGEPVKTVSERLGHASVTVTLTVYGHVMPGDQKRAADRFAALIGEA